jgi:hypothetical protein
MPKGTPKVFPVCANLVFRKAEFFMTLKDPLLLQSNGNYSSSRKIAPYFIIINEEFPDACHLVFRLYV